MQVKKNKKNKKNPRKQIRGGSQARRGGGGYNGRGGRVRRSKTNRGGDLRRECLSSDPACINKEAAERAQTGPADQEQRELARIMSDTCVDCEPPLSSRCPLTPTITLSLVCEGLFL